MLNEAKPLTVLKILHIYIYHPDSISKFKHISSTPWPISLIVQYWILHSYQKERQRNKERTKYQLPVAGLMLCQHNQAVALAL